MDGDWRANTFQFQAARLQLTAVHARGFERWFADEDLPAAALEAILAAVLTSSPMAEISTSPSAEPIAPNKQPRYGLRFPQEFFVPP